MARNEGDPLACAPKRNAEEELVSKDWVAVAEAVRSRMREHHFNQKMLAKRARLTELTISHIRHPEKGHHPYPQTMEMVSEALGWTRDSLAGVAEGRPPREIGEQATRQELGSIQNMLDQYLEKISAIEQHLRKIDTLEERLDGIGDIIYKMGSKFDITIDPERFHHDQ
jgi:hypothetical protein